MRCPHKIIQKRRIIKDGGVTSYVVYLCDYYVMPIIRCDDCVFHYLERKGMIYRFKNAEKEQAT